MSDRLSEIEARLERVEEAVRALNRGAQATRVLPGTPSEAPAASLALLPGRVDSTALLTLAGRTLIVLGGAYALRALTESGRVPTSAGVLLGVAYALAWLGAADRACVVRPLSGFFHGLAAVLIGLPLLWEASTHFRLLTSAPCALALAAGTGLALGVAWHRGLQSLAAVAVFGSLAASAAFIVHTGEPLPFAVGVLALGAATLWLAETRGWSWLLWPPALSADLLLGALIGRASLKPPLDGPSAVLGLQLLLVATYLGFVTWRTLVRNERVWPFDIVQGPLALGIGLGGALAVSRAMPGGVHAGVVGIILALAAGGYLAAFSILNREHRPVTTFSFFATLALVLALVGMTAALPASPLVLAFGALAVAATALGARFAQPTLALHGALFNVSASLTSGLLGMALLVWLASSGWPSIHVLHTLAVAVALWCAAIPRATPIDPRQRHLALLALAARVLLAIVLVVGLGGVIVRLASSLSGDPVPTAGALASIRTVTLAGAALALAWLGRSKRFLEFGWFVYPVLVLGAIKLIVDDFMHSTPGALFLALAAYGTALVLAPRILRRDTQPPGHGAPDLQVRGSEDTSPRGSIRQ